MGESAAPLPLDKAPGEIEGMFDAIARRYDVLNRVLSAGFDRRWRTTAVRALDVRSDARILDLCTGTADLALRLADAAPDAHVVGVDFATQMLRCGWHKVRRASHGTRITLLRGDALHVPLADGSVDAVTVGFGIRNVVDVDAAIAEVARVLRPGGRLAILEFGQPTLTPVRAAYAWYFTRVLPFVGRVVSRHGSAYRYLPASVGAFYPPGVFRAMLETAGLASACAIPLTCGIVYLYTAHKPGE